MVELHVISYVVSDSLLSTEFAEVGGCHLGGAVHLLPISDHPSAALHQGLHLVMDDPNMSFCDGGFTFSSSSNKSPLYWLWMASNLDLFSPRVTSSTEATLLSLSNVARGFSVLFGLISCFSCSRKTRDLDMIFKESSLSVASLDDSVVLSSEIDSPVFPVFFI